MSYAPLLKEHFAPICFPLFISGISVTAQMKNYSFLILLSVSTAIASPLLPFDDSASHSDFTNFQLDPVSNVETVVSSNNDPGLVEQTQPPTPGVSTLQGTSPPRTDSSLDTIQFQSSSPSNFDMSSSRFELAQDLGIEEESPAATKTIYLCCESIEENKYLCDDRQR